MPPATTPQGATATVRWVDPLDGERVEFTVSYASDRARDTAVSRVLANAPAEHPMSVNFQGLVDILAGKPGAPQSALVTSWDVEGAEPNRDTLEGLPEGLLRAVVSAIAADMVGRRRRFCPETYAADLRALIDQERSEEAIALARGATRAYPRLAGTWYGLGGCLFAVGRDGEADAAFTRAIRLGDRREALYWRGISRLRRGRLADGFADAIAGGEPEPPDIPIWRGEFDASAAVLVLADGVGYGYGDSLHAVRYLALVRERVGRVVLACHPPLTRLYESSELADQIIDTTTLDEFLDCWTGQPGQLVARASTLPVVFTDSLDTIPPPVQLRPALVPDRLAGLFDPDDGLRVGLCWANGSHGPGQLRSMDLATLRPLSTVPRITFFALQKGPRSEQALMPPTGLPLVNAGPLLTDFADTAAFVTRLDLVVTVDTAVAHLAGSLGVPTWIMLPRVADWRWFLDREDSPWYPSARLFRQQAAGEWGPVVERVTAELVAFVKAREAAPCRAR